MNAIGCGFFVEPNRANHASNPSRSLIKKLHNDLADPADLRNRDRVLESKNRLGDENARLQQLYDHWHEAIELN